MRIVVLGSGMMGRAIAYDLGCHSNFESITVTDRDRKSLKLVESDLENYQINYDILNVEKKDEVKKYFKKFEIVISAVPYKFNFDLAKIAVGTKTHFLDLGGNNKIVEKERSLFKLAKKNHVTVIHDCGLAPGLSSVIVRDIVEKIDSIDYIKIRVGGLPVNPKPPYNYQIVFSPNGLINEYLEDSILLDHGKILKKESMTELEDINFPDPFGNMEAFLTSGGSSTLPYTFKDKIGYLDYKTVRYPGHCEFFKPLLDFGLGSENPINIGEKTIIPREMLIKFLLSNLPSNEKDVVLLRVIAQGIKNSQKVKIEYSMIDYYDEKNDITSMMRTTSYPTSIIAQMIENNTIKKHGVFGCEEIVPCSIFFKELKKRNINIKKDIK